MRLLPAFALVALLAVAAWLRPSLSPSERPAGAPDPEEEETSAPPAPERIPELLVDRGADEEERLDALDAARVSEFLPEFRRIVLDPSETSTMRSAALLALGRSGDLRALETLAAFYRSFPGFPARHLLIKALDDLEPVAPEARAFLVEALRGEASAGARSHAARALAVPAPSESDRAALRASALSDPAEDVRLAAVGALARAGGEGEFLRTLSGLAGAPPRVRELASRAAAGP